MKILNASAPTLVCLLALHLMALFSQAHAASEDQKLEAFFRDYLDRHFQQQPSRATGLGDHRFDHQLEDLSRASLKEWTRLAQDTLRQLPRTVNYRKLSRASQVDYEILEHRLKQTLWLARHTDPYAEDPRVYNNYISGSIYLLLAQSTLPHDTNVVAAIARMKQIPQILQAAQDNLKEPPRVILETAIRQNKGAMAFYRENLFKLAGDTPLLPELQSEASRVVAALEKHQVFLEDDLLPRAHQENWRVGKRTFARKLELRLNAGLKADTVLKDAEAEFIRVRQEMYILSRQLWSRYYPDQPLPPDDPTGRRDTTQRVLDKVAQDHGRPEDLVRDIQGVVAELKQTISERDILRLPDPDRCQIIEMPEFQRGNSTAYMNSPPPLDPKAIGQYAISPPPSHWDARRVKSYLEEYNSHMLKILTIHEAYPGHYVQFEYANRQPSLIRRVLSSGVYVEGWAVYTEQTLLDQGYGEGDLPLRLTQLKFYLRAVANAILDHKMHARKMTDEEAMNLLARESFQSEGEARLKVIRAKQSSGQLSTYFVGRMAHYRLRMAIQREMGDDFNLGAYHEAVLEQGPIPVKYLPELVRERLKQPR